MANVDLGPWERGAEELLNRFSSICKSDSKEAEDLDEKRRLLVALWVHLNLSSLKQKTELQQVKREHIKQRSNDLIDALCRNLTPTTQRPDLPCIAELTAASLALDWYIAKLRDMPPRHGYECIPVALKSHTSCEEEFWLLRRHELPDRHPTISQSILPNVGFRFHKVIPRTLHGSNVETVVVDFPKKLAKDMFGRFPHMPLRVYAGFFKDDVELDVEWKDDTFLVRGYNGGRTTERKRWKSIKWHLDNAVEKEANILILPEMTVTPDLEDCSLSYLTKMANDGKVLILALGSFHRLDGGQNKNIGGVTLSNGERIFTHAKIHPAFLQPPGTVTAPGHRREDIQCGNVIHCLNTPCGSIVLAICMDF